jgi:hypothetical protein
MKLKTLVAAMALAFANVHGQTTETRATASYLSQGGVAQAWARGITGRGAVIGIVDNGFDLTNTDLVGKVIAAQNFYGSTVTWGTHGTMMASIAAGAANGSGTVGVAPDAKLLLAQAGPGGANTAINARSVASALDWLSSSGATVINLSMGAAYSPTFINSVKLNTRTGIYSTTLPTMDASIADYQTAARRGSVIVASAGNQGLSYVQMPAIFASQTNTNNQLMLGGRMIIVGSVDANNAMASYSNRAGHLCQRPTGTACADTYLTQNFYVVAPGNNLYAAVPNQLGQRGAVATTSGTSGSAAYVSGGIALMRQAWPQLKAEQLVNLVLTTARDLGSPGADAIYGRGLVDFAAATRPQGQLIVAQRNTSLSGSTVTGAALTGTVALFPLSIVRDLRSDSVLQRTQVIDQVGRNYTADLGQALLGRSSANHNPESPWLGMNSYRRVSMPVSESMAMDVLSTQDGVALQTQHQNFSVQVGTVSEKSGFLGNYGTGAMALGSSATNWLQFGLNKSIMPDVDFIANYAQAVTHAQNASDSMITVDPVIQSRSWRAGLRYQDFTVSYGIPVSVTRGRASITAVTGYDYLGTEDAVQAVPIVETKTMDLKLPVQEYNISVNYARWITKTSRLQVNYVHRLNTGGISGLTADSLGVNFTWIQ